MMAIVARRLLGRYHGPAKAIVEGIPWYRVCQDCGIVQDEHRGVNDPCQKCDSVAVVWMPQREGE